MNEWMNVNRWVDSKVLLWMEGVKDELEWMQSGAAG